MNTSWLFLLTPPGPFQDHPHPLKGEDREKLGDEFGEAWVGGGGHLSRKNEQVGPMKLQSVSLEIVFVVKRKKPTHIQNIIHGGICVVQIVHFVVNHTFHMTFDSICHSTTCRVPTRPGKPGKMRVHLENLEISWNFENFNKYHGKMT